MNEPHAVHGELVDGCAEITDLSDVDSTPDISQATKVEVYATIIRADGRQEDLGMIAGTYNFRRAPLSWLKWKLYGKSRAALRARRANRAHARRELS